MTIDEEGLTAAVAAAIEPRTSRPPERTGGTTTWERTVASIAVGLCRNGGPAPDCWCGRYKLTCHAPTLWRHLAEAAARQLDRDGLMPKTS